MLYWTLIFVVASGCLDTANKRVHRRLHFLRAAPNEITRDIYPTNSLRYVSSQNRKISAQISA